MHVIQDLNLTYKYISNLNEGRRLNRFLNCNLFEDNLNDQHIFSFILFIALWFDSACTNFMNNHHFQNFTNHLNLLIRLISLIHLILLIRLIRLYLLTYLNHRLNHLVNSHFNRSFRHRINLSHNHLLNHHLQYYIGNFLNYNFKNIYCLHHHFNCLMNQYMELNMHHLMIWNFLNYLVRLFLSTIPSDKNSKSLDHK